MKVCPFDKGFGTIVAERIADTVMLFIIITIAFFLEFEFIYNFFVEKFNPYKIVDIWYYNFAIKHFSFIHIYKEKQF